MFQLAGGDGLELLAQRQQLPRFADEGGVAAEGGAGLAGDLGGGVMHGGYVGGGVPLRLALHAGDGLVAGVEEAQENLRALLGGRRGGRAGGRT